MEYVAIFLFCCGFVSGFVIARTRERELADARVRSLQRIAINLAIPERWK